MKEIEVSTKIYNGYVAKKTEIGYFLNTIVSLRNEVDNLAVDLMSKEIKNQIEKGFSEDWRSALKVMKEELKETEREGIRNPCSDFTLELSVLPLDGNLYILIFTESEKLKQFIVDKLKLEYFGYWNNSDPIDGMTDREWEERGKLWHEAMPDGCPAHYGFNYTFISYTDQKVLMYALGDLMEV